VKWGACLPGVKPKTNWYSLILLYDHGIKEERAKNGHAPHFTTDAVYFEKIISKIVCMLRICQIIASDINITSHSYT
jgi:hypothetical protein